MNPMLKSNISKAAKVIKKKFTEDYKKIINSLKEYSIERFSEVLKVQHCYSIFLLISVFPLLKCTNEQTITKVHLPYINHFAAFEIYLTLDFISS